MINKLIKKLFAIIAVLAIALTMALKVNLNAKNNNLSDISLANVEALAQSEYWEPNWYIYGIVNTYWCGYTWETCVHEELFYWCEDGGSEPCNSYLP